MSMEAISGSNIESDITFLSQGSSIQGQLVFDRFTRIHGRVEGSIRGTPGSTIVIGESASIHADIEGENVFVDGFVHGNITATEKITISQTGKVIGALSAGKIELHHGSFFEGKAATSRSIANPVLDTIAPSV